MPRLYPPDPHFADDAAGGAERAVWQALGDQLPDEAALFADVTILDQTREHELDLLIAWPGLTRATLVTPRWAAAWRGPARRSH